MKKIFLIGAIAAFFQGSMAQSIIRKESYHWISSEFVPRDSKGKVKGVPYWDTMRPQPSPYYDTFLVYKNYDSIRMIVADDQSGMFFKKVDIHADKWKPTPGYGPFFFLGNYEAEGMDGMYLSFYLTKNWRNLLEVSYSNIGYLMDAQLFSKDPQNILQKSGILITPKDEQIEPTKWKIKLQ